MRFLSSVATYSHKLVAMSAALAFGVVTADVNTKNVMVKAINNFFIL
jgi:hypothetical protein